MTPLADLPAPDLVCVGEVAPVPLAVLLLPLLFVVFALFAGFWPTKMTARPGPGTWTVHPPAHETVLSGTLPANVAGTGFASPTPAYVCPPQAILVFSATEGAESVRMVMSVLDEGMKDGSMA